MVNDRLTTRQEAFANDVANKKYGYIWEAYVANYTTKGWSQNSIYVEACKLRSHPKVSLRIDEIENKIKEKEKITLDEIIVKLSNRCDLDVRDMYNDDGSFKNIKELTKDQALFLVGIDTQEIWGWTEGDDGKKHKNQIGTVKKVKIESIKDIMDMLIKVYGGYIKDNEQKSDGNLDAIRAIVEGITG